MTTRQPSDEFYSGTVVAALRALSEANRRGDGEAGRLLLQAMGFLAPELIAIAEAGRQLERLLPHICGKSPHYGRALDAAKAHRKALAALDARLADVFDAQRRSRYRPPPPPRTPDVAAETAHAQRCAGTLPTARARGGVR